MTVLLPGLVALELQTVLVAARRGQVLHLAADPHRDLTPTGRLRSGRRPLCNRLCRRARSTLVDGRRLCRACAARAARSPHRVLEVPRLVRASAVALALATARDEQTVEAGYLEVCRAGAGTRVDGIVLTRHVLNARRRLSTRPEPSRPLLPAARREPLTQRSRKAMARERYARLVDLPGGAS